MNDRFSCCPVERLLSWILAEEKTGAIFGIPESLFFHPKPDDPFRMERYGRILETPLGVAAGPHTQMAQNIVSAWLTGARYLELKTVQTLDRLDVTKPCIDMTDEGYNCEWSQELTLDESFSEYLNAWILLHILGDRFRFGDETAPGFLFNMSVGYNLEGIMNANVQKFLDRMADCRKEKNERIERLARLYPRVAELAIPDTVSDNLTISTMHGCPPEEIEKIAEYFITQRKVHTTIKLNPTLLGPERLRHLLNEKLGFDVVVPDEAFAHDLKWEDGLVLIRNLEEKAKAAGVAFNLKLTNTLETENRAGNLPGSESMVYMSGRALHPISICLAERLQKAFDGRLDISFSAGVDCFNAADLLACGLKPLTVCSDLLKPGGYGRLSQYAETMREEFAKEEAEDIPSLIEARAKANGGKTMLDNLSAYAEKAAENPAYAKSSFPYESIKTDRELPVFDCAAAPCMSGCPAGQNIPAYLRYTAAGDDKAAWRVITATNPFAHVQSMVCDHRCQTRCTRMNIDAPLRIREIKRFVADRFDAPSGQSPAQANGKKVAVIGAGPSGLSCASFLALGGFKVKVFEARDRAGGMAAGAIPSFRLDDGSLKKDIDAITALGVEIHYGARVDRELFERLSADVDAVYVAVGAQKSVRLGIEGEDSGGVMDQLDFLRAVRNGNPPELGARVVVVGGGNSAMDVARTARRLVGASGSVSVIYRRTRKEMPADIEEVEAALDEGIRLHELTAPECLLAEDGHVVSNLCFRMKLGEADASGRRAPIAIEGSEFAMDADCVITALGQRVEADFLPDGELRVDPVSLKTPIAGVYAGGDAVRGASTLIRAIGDGKRAAETIAVDLVGKTGREEKGSETDGVRMDPTELIARSARRQMPVPVPEIAAEESMNFDIVTGTLDEESARKEAARCLQCDIVCNICTTVCPNRANVAYRLPPVSLPMEQAVMEDGDVRIRQTGLRKIRQPFQIVHIGDFCNECGNCATFCPTSGAPYRTKPRFWLTEESFVAADRGYRLDGDRLEYKSENGIESVTLQDGELLVETTDYRAVLEAETLACKSAEMLDGKKKTVDLHHSAEMGMMLKALRGAPFGGRKG